MAATPHPNPQGPRASPAPRRLAGRAMFGREAFIVRVAEDAMAPRVRVDDYVWVDTDEPLRISPDRAAVRIRNSSASLEDAFVPQVALAVARHRATSSYATVGRAAP